VILFNLIPLDPLIVYFEHRKILLLSGKPANVPVDDWCFKFKNAKKLKMAIAEFEQTSHVQTLILWSDDRSSELVRKFFSCFNVVEAAGGVVKNEKEEILFIHRLGKWDLPKGKISRTDRLKKEKETRQERKENTLMRAGTREVMEETGIKNIRILRPLFPTHHIYYQRKKRILKKTYWFEMISSSNEILIPQTKEAIVEARWIPKEMLKEIKAQSYPSLDGLINFISS
jgi:8-oxo-dGTP pyrophosphatase MutT (NUDIX family)